MLRAFGIRAGAEQGWAQSSSPSTTFSSTTHTASDANTGVGLVMERVETVIENGRWVTKKIRQQANGETHASIEETEQGRTRIRSGVRRSDEL